MYRDRFWASSMSVLILPNKLERVSLSVAGFTMASISLKSGILACNFVCAVSNNVSYFPVPPSFSTIGFGGYIYGLAF